MINYGENYMLYTIMSSIEHNKHYLNRYLRLIILWNKANRLQKPAYTEKHHICPKAQDMFPEFISFREFPWNCANLTRKQHLLAHKLLVKAYPNSVGAIAGLAMMLRNNNESNLDLLKNTVVVKNLTGKYFRVSTADERYLLGELTHNAVGRVSVVDKNNTTTSVSKELFETNKSLRGVAAGTVTVKDKQGSYLRVSKDDERILSKELVGVTKGFTTVKNAEGIIMQVAISDTRIVTGELQHINKGRVVVKDREGITFQVDINDSRYKSGELVSASKGRKAPNLKISDEDMLLLRQKYKDKSENFPMDFLKEVIRDSDKKFIGIKTLEQLKLRNHKLATYDLLFCAYYSKIYGIPTTRIKEAVEGRSYKHLPI